jgi:nucleotide-binding universal stress UspA family protein
MESIKKILVPTDFSKNAESAYEHSQEIARRFGAKVDFIHIIPTLKYFHESISNLEGSLDTEGEIYPKAQKEAVQKLNELMDAYLSDEHRGEAICRIGRKPSARMLDWAGEGDYDLIVMASKGRHNSHLLRGSTTEKVIRHSEIPVFTVDAQLSPKGLKRILLPTDGSKISLSALPMALSIADIYKAEITFYHAIELYGSSLDDDRVRNPKKSDEENIYEALIDSLEDYLDNEELGNIQINRGEVDFEDQFIIIEGASSHSVNFHTVIEKSVTAHVGIENYADEHADVVVMATHGHSGWAHLFLGSTTERVAQYLNIPVVTVRPDVSKLKER